MLEMLSRSASRFWIAATAVAWTAAVGWGFYSLARYESSPGVSAQAPRTWPADAPVALDPERLTLVLFAHPHCPCTRATLGELDRIVAASADRLRVHVLFYADEKLGRGWEHSDLWEHAAATPGVDVRADPLGAAAQRFGARTSGQVVVYAPSGELVFDGGITNGRGHSGDNAGAAAIEQLARGVEPASDSTCVFGCSLTAETTGDGARVR